MCGEPHPVQGASPLRQGGLPRVGPFCYATLKVRGVLSRWVFQYVLLTYHLCISKFTTRDVRTMTKRRPRDRHQETHSQGLFYYTEWCPNYSSHDLPIPGPPELQLSLLHIARSKVSTEPGRSDVVKCTCQVLSPEPGDSTVSLDCSR
jgi:hypothetical protein